LNALSNFNRQVSAASLLRRVRREKPLRPWFLFFAPLRETCLKQKSPATPDFAYREIFF
jgi:hypothetical protein